MPDFDLGIATTSTRAAQLIKDGYERPLPEGETLTTAQIIARIRGDTRDRLARLVRIEKQNQRQEANVAEDVALDGEVTI